jgi:hypothetical protein
MVLDPLLTLPSLSPSEMCRWQLSPLALMVPTNERISNRSSVAIEATCTGVFAVSERQAWLAKAKGQKAKRGREGHVCDRQLKPHHHKSAMLTNTTSLSTPNNFVFHTLASELRHDSLPKRSTALRGPSVISLHSPSSSISFRFVAVAFANLLQTKSSCNESSS